MVLIGDLFLGIIDTTTEVWYDKKAEREASLPGFAGRGVSMTSAFFFELAENKWVSLDMYLGREIEDMKLTSAEANKMIRALKDQHRLLALQEDNVLSFIAATTENVDEVRPPYSYEETAVKYDEIERKIRTIKHALNVFNATTVVDGFDMTIDEMLVFLPQTSERLRKLEDMLAKPEKSRAMNTGRTSIIEYEYLNYDLQKVQEDYDALMDLKSRALTALDVVNNTVPFEVER